MKLFSIDIRMIATAYVAAASEEEARKIVADSLTDTGGDLPVSDYSDTGGDVTVSGYSYGHPKLYEYGWSLSPAVTIVGPEHPQLEEVCEVATIAEIETRATAEGWTNLGPTEEGGPNFWSHPDEEDGPFTAVDLASDIFDVAILEEDE